MKIKIEDIPDIGLAVDLREDGKTLEEAAGGSLDFSFSSPVEARLELNKTEGNVFVNGEITASIRLVCGRCLKEFEHPLHLSFTDLYVSEKEAGRERELKAADLEVNYLKNGEIDTLEVLLGQISLEAPMQPLCKADCLGLCPKCGADLNAGPCGCAKDEKTESKFAKLKDFKVK